MTHLIIKKKNEVFVTIDSEQYVYHELSDHFTFEVPGAKFMPQYRNKYWDGKIRLYDMRKNEIYTGLGIESYHSVIEKDILMSLKVVNSMVCHLKRMK